MKPLPLIDGCTLDASGRDGQRDRLEVLRGSVRAVERDPGELRVRFGAGVDERLLGDLIAVERGCCSFLGLEYDTSGRVLRIASADRGDALDRFAGLFATEGSA